MASVAGGSEAGQVNQVEIEVTITFDDMLEFNMYHTMKSPMVRRQRLGLLGVALVVLIGWSGLVLLTESPAEKAWALWPFLVFSIVMFWFFVRFSAAMQRRMKKLLREGANPGLLGRRNFRLTDEGVAEISDIGHSLTSWAAITRIEETESAIYLYNSSVSAHIVPTRAFPHPQAVRDFVDAARRSMAHHAASRERAGR